MADKKKQPKQDSRNKIQDSGEEIINHESCLMNLEKAQKEIIELKEQMEVGEGKYRRALADYQNLERQTNEQSIRFVKLATKDFVEQLVEPYDHLLLAAKHLKDKGLDLVISQFKQVFESQGLKEINPVGLQFDPSKMEAIDTKEGEEGKVIEVVSNGYELNGLVIKHAKVIVGK